MVKKEIIDILRRYIELLRSEGIGVEKALLYGSCLRGEETGDSDIDLMIVTDVENDDAMAGKAWSLTRKINSKIEPFLVGKARFYQNESSPLIELVKNTGLEIH